MDDLSISAQMPRVPATQRLHFPPPRHSASHKLFWRSDTVNRNRASKIEAAMDPQKASALRESFSEKDGHGINQWLKLWVSASEV